jgi:hypothetical protein
VAAPANGLTQQRPGRYAPKSQRLRAEWIGASLWAAWFHLIPIYGLYWVFKWPRELARFANRRLQVPFMNPDRTGLAVFAACTVFLALDRGFGMILPFWCVLSDALSASCTGGAAGFARGSTAFFVRY